jgi:hypothetical protein
MKTASTIHEEIIDPMRSESEYRVINTTFALDQCETRKGRPSGQPLHFELF